MDFIAYDDQTESGFQRYGGQVVQTDSAPVLASTRSYSAKINLAFSKTLTQIGGDAATSWDITGGADQLEYSLTNAGALTRDSIRATVGVEVITVTATNATGPSNTQTITIRYVKSKYPATKFRRFPAHPYNKLG